MKWLTYAWLAYIGVWFILRPLMKRSLLTLAPLFPKRGDSGDTGDKSGNHLNLHDFGVTTRRRVSPVDESSRRAATFPLRWRSLCRRSGLVQF
jgi:hypothetical protein